MAALPALKSEAYTLVEGSPRKKTMADVSCSVPDDEEKKRQQRRAAAIDALLELRRQQQPVSQEEITRARQMGRP